MRKLLHLVFAVWKTDRPFEGDHFPWANPAADKPATAAAAPAPAEGAIPAGDQEAETAVGHKRDLPAGKVVTTATPTVGAASSPVKPAPPPPKAERPRVDFAFLREHGTMVQVLEHRGLMGQLHGRGQQRRGPCPVHGQPTDANRSFSVHLGKNVFQCFHADCGLKGNVLDLWAAIHRRPLYEAALHLAETFGLALNREEEPVKGTRSAGSVQTPASADTASCNAH